MLSSFNERLVIRETSQSVDMMSSVWMRSSIHIVVVVVVDVVVHVEYVVVARRGGKRTIERAANEFTEVVG